MKQKRDSKPLPSRKIKEEEAFWGALLMKQAGDWVCEEQNDSNGSFDLFQCRNQI